MKIVQFLSTAIFASALIFSCSSDDPDPVVEEEVITTMTITLEPFDDQISSVILQTQDLDQQSNRLRPSWTWYSSSDCFWKFIRKQNVLWINCPIERD